jgi:phospholipid/cholesterol/gamma-HCH transport system permease protein
VNIVERIGARLLAPRVLAAGVAVAVGLQALARCGHLARRRRPLLDQMHLAGVKTLPVVLLVNLFIGMILALQLGYELARYGQEQAIGLAVSVAMVREMAPVMTAVLLAAAVASAMAAELGTMTVQEEVTALEVMSVDVPSFLVVPRVFALALMAPVLTILGSVIGILGGGVIAVTQLGLDFDGYLINAVDALRDRWVWWLPVPKSLYAALIKSAVFGFTIAVVGCASGLQARHGARGVGDAVRAAVRNSIILIIVLNFFLGKLIYTD